MRNPAHQLVIVLAAATLILSACGAPAAAPATEPPAAQQPAAQLAATEPAPVADNLSGTISVSGAFALYPMMTVWADEFHKLHPGVEFDVQGGGAGKGMTDVLSGAVDIGMISRQIKPEEEAQGAYWVSVTKDAVFPIISANSPYAARIQETGISQEVFAGVFISGEIKTWGEIIGDPEVTDEVHVYTRSDSSGAAEMWAKFAGGSVQDDLKGIGINGEPAMLDTVLKDPLGIGYSNLNSVFDLATGTVVAGVLIPAIDINANGQAEAGEILVQKADAFKAVADGTYPSPPARFENLATRDKPAGLALTFIQWILTDGQAFLPEAGYVPLTAEQQAESLQKLK